MYQRKNRIFPLLFLFMVQGIAAHDILGHQKSLNYTQGDIATTDDSIGHPKILQLFTEEKLDSDGELSFRMTFALSEGIHLLRDVRSNRDRNGLFDKIETALLRVSPKGRIINIDYEKARQDAQDPFPIKEITGIIFHYATKTGPYLIFKPLLSLIACEDILSSLFSTGTMQNWSFDSGNSFKILLNETIVFPAAFRLEAFSPSFSKTLQNAKGGSLSLVSSYVIGTDKSTKQAEEPSSHLGVDKKNTNYLLFKRAKP